MCSRKIYEISIIPGVGLGPPQVPNVIVFIILPLSHLATEFGDDRNQKHEDFIDEQNFA
jgi:hypothetical protein